MIFFQKFRTSTGKVYSKKSVLLPKFFVGAKASNWVDLVRYLVQLTKEDQFSVAPVNELSKVLAIF